MKPAAFKAMLAAAKDIVRHADEPFTSEYLDPFTVHWARDVVAFNPARVLAPSQAKVLRIFEADQTAGFSVPQIREFTGIVGPALLSTMTLMKNAGLVFQLFQWGRSRYFASQAALEAGRPAFEANELAYREKRTVVKPRPQKFTYDKAPSAPPLLKIPTLKAWAKTRTVVAPAPKPPKPAKPPKPPKHEKPPKKPHLGRGGGGAFNPDNAVKIPKKTLLHSGVAFIPDHIKVQVIPTGQDMRYRVDPKDVKGGFADEWARARQVGHLRTGEES
jgi:hypothetical protein